MNTPGDPNVPTQSARDVGLTVRDLVLEVRKSVDLMREDLITFKPSVVTKAELDLFKITQQSTRRWSIGIIFSIIAASGTGVSIVVAVT